MRGNGHQGRRQLALRPLHWPKPPIRQLDRHLRADYDQPSGHRTTQKEEKEREEGGYGSNQGKRNHRR